MNAGIFINSTSLLDDTFFEKTIIFIAEYNEQGAMGFVVNKQFPRRFNELYEFRASIPFPLYEGGPVDQEHVFFVHQRPDLIPGGTLIADNIYLGGDFKAAVRHINHKTITSQDIKLFIGYCGWDQQELEAEIAEGSWVVEQEGMLF
ncbi:YqgE/AlgH family protein [Chitinophaga nivalis]|uniref:YqgE/AlgH family protein n=1 Tax=Chitinophaga nivalis TaxID=2991709 RepID=A0ABT3IFE7_9BACT|nr:YqgE/AlgH family protein [Chitinophaga nivalis]MCW3467622.1 YqgE/AlgH family protein [Chitinophaga nivalis]MCW3482686.1 YqgE/AlgH family protein [Chitinophaga nivalis]